MLTTVLNGSLGLQVERNKTMSALRTGESRVQWEKSPTGSVVTRQGSVPMVRFVDSWNEANKGKLELSPDEKENAGGSEIGEWMLVL
jgi:hypothetical protein